MKNRLFCLLLACLFVIGSSAFSIMDSGAIGDVLIGKNGTTVSSFSVPNKYLDKGGALLYPMEISISQNGKQPVFSTCGTDLTISLPASLSGTFLLEVHIADFNFQKELKL